MKRLLFISIAAAIFAFTACDKPDEGKMQKVTLQGVVYDTSGAPLSGVYVTTGSEKTTTDKDGKFSLNKVEVMKFKEKVDDRAIIKFEKSGYFTLTRSGVKENEMFITAVLTQKGNSDISLQTSFDVSEAKNLEVGGMKVSLPASSVVRADGSAYSGKVNADMLYLDPNNPNFATMMPGGDLLGIREDGSESILVSYGMTDLILTDANGNPLQLNSDKPAEVTFPIPAGMENDAPVSIPLWSFDETKGIWIEEGVATRRGDVYVGEVTHFSWVNLDDPEKIVIIKGKVVDCENKPVSYVMVNVGQSAGATNSKGEYSVMVPEYTPVTVSVSANGGSDSENVPGQPGGTTYKVRDLKVPCAGGGGGGGEPWETDLEKASVEYLMDGGSVMIITFDNKGWRLRWDIFGDTNRDPEDQFVYCINHIDKTFWYGFGGEWFDQTYDENQSPVIPFYWGEGYPGLLQTGTTTIAGKLCKVYTISYGGNEVIIALWNGLMMSYELDGEVLFMALNVTLVVPDVAFTKTFDITWI